MRYCVAVRARVRCVVSVAQLVELLVVVQAVVGSSPIVHPRQTVVIGGCGGTGRRARFRS